MAINPRAGRTGLITCIVMVVYILLLVPFATPAVAGSGISLVLNGTKTEPTAEVYIDNNGRTMVPIRFIMEYMGASVEWLSGEKKVVVKRGTTTLEMRIDSTRAYINGQEITLDTVPVIKNSSTMVPVRFVSQAFGGAIGWDAGSRIVSISLGQDQGQGVSYVRITGSYVNFRSGPSLTSSILDVLPRGTVLKLLAVSNDWYQVQQENRTGWVSTSYSERVQDSDRNVIPSRPNTPIGTAVIGARPVAVLAGPSPVEGQVGTANSGSRLTIWQEMDGWWQVELEDGRRGWLPSSLATYAPYQPPDGSEQEYLEITGITVKLESDAVLVTVQANKSFSYRTSRWDNRLVVDIDGAELKIASGNNIVEVNKKPLIRVRSGQFTPDTVRIVFDLYGSAAMTSTAEGNGKGMVFQLREPSIQGARIVIDPGHGTDGKGTDPGAIGPGGTKEKDINLAVSLKLAELLKSAGASVFLTRSGESLPYYLAERAYYANDIGADIFVSIHCNASLSAEANGTSTFYYAPAGTELGEQRGERQRLASSIQRGLVNSINRKDLGIKESNFSVLRNTTMPSVLVEIAFISNPVEEKLLKDPVFQDKAAQGIFNGINDYFAGN